MIGRVETALIALLGDFEIMVCSLKSVSYRIVDASSSGFEGSAASTADDSCWCVVLLNGVP